MKKYSPILIVVVFLLFCSWLLGRSTLYYIEKYSARYGVDKRIVYSLIKAESEGDPEARSYMGAVGIGQVKAATARDYYKEKGKEYDWGKWWAKQSLKSIAEHLKIEGVNIQITCWYLRKCLDKADGNYIRALNMYNNGPNHDDDRISWEYINKIIIDVANIE